MLKQWYSIERVWEVMQTTEQAKNIRYERIGFFRTDVVYVTPIDIQAGGDAVIPNFGFIVNDRMFYGSYENAHIWANSRFASASCYEPRHRDFGLHSEFFMYDFVLPLIANKGVNDSEPDNDKHYKNHTVINKSDDICFYRIRASGKISENDCRQAYRMSPIYLHLFGSEEDILVLREG